MGVTVKGKKVVPKPVQLDAEAMKIVMLPPSSIYPAKDNPRINDQAVPAVAKSIKEFGFRQPIVVDEDMNILVGHTRHKAAIHLGLARVPVHVAEGLTPAQRVAYRAVDNKTNELATWDLSLLQEQVGSMMQEGIDLTQFGFSQEDVNKLLAEEKKDVRWLENFDTLPMPKPKWILISAPEDECANIIDALKQLDSPNVKYEYSGDK